jgi:hypothetical protein
MASATPGPLRRRAAALAGPLIAGAMLLAAAGAAAQPAYQRTTLSRFAVDVPSHWSVAQRDDDPAAIVFKVVEAAAGQPTASCVFRAMDAAGLFAGRSAIEIEKTRDYAISPAGMRTGLPEDERGLEWGETSISGEKAGLLVTQNPEASVRRLSVMAMTEKATYFVVCSTHAAMFDDRRKVFERILASFVILE